jgi:hypothetical protein
MASGDSALKTLLMWGWSLSKMLDTVFRGLRLGKALPNGLQELTICWPVASARMISESGKFLRTLRAWAWNGAMSPDASAGEVASASKDARAIARWRSRATDRILAVAQQVLIEKRDSVPVRVVNQIRGSEAHWRLARQDQGR